jgi:peptidoglycan/LPS O-acetylase OafA/YrhL
MCGHLGHAYALVPGAATTEPIGGLLGFDYSGSLAVEFFFFLSGILVTNSWINNSSPLDFILARFFRVFPAILVSAAACVLLLGPMLTTLPLNSYFADSSVFQKYSGTPISNTHCLVCLKTATSADQWIYLDDPV